jgi:hypothetical protein
MTKMTRQKFLEHALKVAAGGLLAGAGWRVAERQSAGTMVQRRVLEPRGVVAFSDALTVSVETYEEAVYYLVVEGFEAYLPLVESPKGVTLWSREGEPLVCFPIPRAKEVQDVAVFELSAELAREAATFDVC